MSEARNLQVQKDSSLSQILDYIKREFGMIDKEIEAIKMRIMIKESKKKSPGIPHLEKHITSHKINTP
jgi:hypothetical protein